MCADRQIGIVGCWRYLLTEREGDGVFVIVRRDAAHDIFEEELGSALSLEYAEVVAAALIAHERRKKWPGGEI